MSRSWRACCSLSRRTGSWPTWGGGGVVHQWAPGPTTPVRCSTTISTTSAPSRATTAMPTQRLPPGGWASSTRSGCAAACVAGSQRFRHLASLRLERRRRRAAPVGGEHGEARRGWEQAVERCPDDRLAGADGQPAPDRRDEVDQGVLDDRQPRQRAGDGRGLVADQRAERRRRARRTGPCTRRWRGWSSHTSRRASSDSVADSLR